MTPRQSEALIFIYKYWEQNACCPSYEEIRVYLGLASKSGIYRIVKSLEERGHITHIPGRERSITVKELPEALYKKLRAENVQHSDNK